MKLNPVAETIECDASLQGLHAVDPSGGLALGTRHKAAGDAYLNSNTSSAAATLHQPTVKLSRYQDQQQG